MSVHNLTAGRRFNPGIALGALMFTAVATIALARWQAPPPVPANEPIAALRLLQFVDMADGAVGAIDVATGTTIARFEGEQGFLRGTLRAVSRERRLHGLGQTLPVELIAHTDGRLSLHDPATGTRIALESFGTTNAGVFARLLH